MKKTDNLFKIDEDVEQPPFTFLVKKMLRFRRFSRVILKVFKILLVCVKELTNSKSSGYEDDGKLGWCENDLFFTCEFQGRQVPELLFAG